MRETQSLCLANTYTALLHLLWGFFCYNENCLNFMGCWYFSELSRFEAGEGKKLVAQIIGKYLFFFINKKKRKWDLNTRCLQNNMIQPYKLQSLLEACKYSIYCTYICRCFFYLLQLKSPAGTNTTKTNQVSTAAVGRWRQTKTHIFFFSSLLSASFSCMSAVFIV